MISMGQGELDEAFCLGALSKRVVLSFVCRYTCRPHHQDSAA